MTSALNRRVKRLEAICGFGDDTTGLAAVVGPLNSDIGLQRYIDVTCRFPKRSWFAIVDETREDFEIITDSGQALERFLQAMAESDGTLDDPHWPIWWRNSDEVKKWRADLEAKYPHSVKKAEPGSGCAENGSP